MTPGNEPADEQLMRAYREGDVSAFETLYRRHRGGLYRYLVRQLGERGVAEELFQDVWIRIVGARQRYLATARFATYLYRIAHNLVIDHYRRVAAAPRAVSGATSDELMADLAADPNEQPDRQLHARTQIERLQAALAALPSEQREAFLLQEEGGLSVDEIAAATGVTRETAKSRLRYALAKLRRGLREVE